MKRAILINGYPGSGKDTFAEFCSKFCKVDNVLTSTPAKEALKLLGWNGEKSPEARDLLAHLISISYEHFDGPVNYVLDEYVKSDADLFFVHVREPHNILLLKKRLGEVGANVMTVFVDRKSQRGIYNNESDMNVENFGYDMIIDNNSTLEELKGYAFSFSKLAVKGWI